MQNPFIVARHQPHPRALAGDNAGLLGVGAGTRLVPGLVRFLAVPEHLAKGTSLVAVIPIAIAGAWRHRRNGPGDLPLGGVVGLVGTATALAGGMLSGHIAPRRSAVSFGVLLIVVAAHTLHEEWRTRPPGGGRSMGAGTAGLEAARP